MEWSGVEWSERQVADSESELPERSGCLTLRISNQQGRAGAGRNQPIHAAQTNSRREEHATTETKPSDEKRSAEQWTVDHECKHGALHCTAHHLRSICIGLMTATLPIGQWSWHERSLYPNQIADLPDRPAQHAAVHRQLQQHAQTARQQQQQQQQYQQEYQHQQQQQYQQQQYQHQQSQQSDPPPAQPSHLTLRHLSCGLAANNPQAALNLQLPSVPRRYRDGTLKRTTSEYCATYRHPQSFAAEMGGDLDASRSVRSVAAESGLVPGSRLPTRERGRMNAPSHFLHHHSASHSASLRPEQHSFRLWGRINNAHCVVPYETSSQRDFAAEHLDHRDPIDTSRHMRIQGKEYTEALAKAKFTQVIRGDRAK